MVMLGSNRNISKYIHDVLTPINDGPRPPRPPLKLKFHSHSLWQSGGGWNPLNAFNWGLAAGCGCSRFSCLFLLVRRWFSSLNRWIAATSFSGSIKHSDLCVSIDCESSRCPQPQGQSTSIPAGQISRCCHKSLRSISAPQLSFGHETVMHGHSRARWTGMSPRLPTQGHPCPRNWQKLCRLETSLSAKRSGAMSPDTSVRHSGHCDFCGSQSSRQAPQKTCLCHRSARTVSTEVPLGKVKCVSARQRWVVLGTGSSLRAHPHAVRTGCVKSFRQIGQIRLGSGGLSSSCSGSSQLVVVVGDEL